MQGGLTLALALLDFFPNSSVPFLGDFEGTCPAMSESHMDVGQINQSCLPYFTQASLACAGKEKSCTSVAGEEQPCCQMPSWEGCAPHQGKFGP